jgi:hypothetical protein
MRPVLPFVLLLLSASAVQAQSTMTGTVLDEETGGPLENARVTLRASNLQLAAITDSAGQFVFPHVSPGYYQIHAQRVGFEPTRQAGMRVRDRDTVSLEIRLGKDVIILAPVEVVARSERRASPILEDFYHRVRSGTGRYITREQIEARNAFYVSDLLVSIPGIHVMPNQGTMGRNVYMSRTLPRSDGCPVQIYVDGAHINPRLLMSAPGGDTLTVMTAQDPGFSIDDVVHPASIEGIEVYAGLASVPAQFMGPDARCGTVAIWTRRGR